MPRSGILKSSGEGYLIMVDSPWRSDMAQCGPDFYSVCLDVYCPGQSIYLREESQQLGFTVMEESIRKVV